MTPLQKHFIWANLIRVIAICLVVLIHSFQVEPVHSFSVGLSLVLFGIAKVAVPLFVMLSGALLLPKRESWWTFFQKRFKRVGIPWLFWTLVFTLYFFLLDKFPLLTLPREFLKNFSAQFSFLPMIASLYLVMPLLRVFIAKAKKFEVWYFVFIWFIAVSVLPYLRNSLAFPLSVDNGLVRQTVEYSGYLVLGYLLTDQKFLQMRLKVLVATWLLTLGVLLYFVMRGNGFNLTYLNYVSPLVVVLSACSFLGIILGVKFFSRIVVAQRIKSLSSASFGVFLIHSFLLKHVLQFQHWLHFSDHFIENAVRWLGTLSLSFMIIFLLRKIPKLGTVVFG